MKHVSLSVVVTGFVALGLSAAANAQFDTPSSLGVRTSAPDGRSLTVPVVTPRAARDAQPVRAPAVGSIPAPPGYTGAVTGFGGAVDVDGDRIIWADETPEVYIYNLAAGAYESLGLIAENNLPFPTLLNIRDVTIEGDVAVVGYSADIFGDTFDGMAASYQWNGTSWVLIQGQLFGESVASPPVLHEGSLFVVRGDDTSSVKLSAVFRQDPISLASSVTPVIFDELPVELSVGDDPNGSLIGVTFENVNTGARTVRAWRWDGTSFIDLGVVSTGTAADDYGAALAVADGLIWVGSPRDDTGATDGGLVELYFDDGAGGWGFGGSIFALQDGDQLGRELAVDGDTLATSERNADLVPSGPDGVGAVRLVRHDGLGAWNLTGEIFHGFDLDYTTPDDFGAAVALDGSTLFVGEPGPNAAVSWWFLPATSQFEVGLAPPLAGTGGLEPVGAPLGNTFDGQPFALELFDALPNSLVTLIVSLDVSETPFKGGVLWPSPDLLLNFNTDANGVFFLATSWAGVAGSFTLQMQAWIVDPGAFKGLSSSQGFSVRQD